MASGSPAGSRGVIAKAKLADYGVSAGCRQRAACNAAMTVAREQQATVGTVPAAEIYAAFTFTEIK